MKKIALILTCLVMLVTFAACDKEEKKTAPEEMDMDAVYTKLADAVALPEMLPLNEDLMLDFCGIRSEYVLQAKVLICADSLRTDEIWLIEAKDDEAAKTIVDLANRRLGKKGEESITYSPEQYAVVQKAKLLQQGRFIALLVSPDSETLAQVFRQEAGL